MRFSLFLVLVAGILLSSCSLFQSGQSRYSHVKKVRIDAPLEYAHQNLEKMPVSGNRTLSLEIKKDEKLAMRPTARFTETKAEKKEGSNRFTIKEQKAWSFPQLKKQAKARQMESSSGADTTHILLTILLIVLIFALLAAIIPGIIEILLSVLLIVLLVLLILYLAGSI